MTKQESFLAIEPTRYQPQERETKMRTLRCNSGPALAISTAYLRLALKKPAKKSMLLDSPLTHSRMQERTRQRSHRTSDAKESDTHREKSRRELASSSSRDASAKQQADNQALESSTYHKISTANQACPEQNTTDDNDDVAREGDASEARSKQERTEWLSLTAPSSPAGLDQWHRCLSAYIWGSPSPRSYSL